MNRFDRRRPCTRTCGALASNFGNPSTIVSVAACEAAMKAGIRWAGCWPSESIVSTCVKPCAAAALSPASTATPLPRLRDSTITRSPGSCSAMACRRSVLPSVLPSTTTQTGFHCARALRTVSSTLTPGL
jgi:hypothetical protein